MLFDIDLLTIEKIVNYFNLKNIAMRYYSTTIKGQTKN